MAFYTDVFTSFASRQRLGTRRRDRAGNEYIFLSGASSMAAGDAVLYDEAFAATRSLQATQGPLAVAMAAVDATTDYGWFQIWGRATVNVLASFADNGDVFTTSTAGSLDDSGAGAEEYVFGAVGRSAIDTPSTGKAYIQLSYPWKGKSNLD